MEQRKRLSSAKYITVSQFTQRYRPYFEEVAAGQRFVIMRRSRPEAILLPYTPKMAMMLDDILGREDAVFDLPTDDEESPGALGVSES